jgi:hypothetical protein
MNKIKTYGFTLIELLISIAFGLIVIVFCLIMYFGNGLALTVEDTRTQTEITKDNYGVKKLFGVDGCSVYQYHIHNFFKEFVICPCKSEMIK